ncbi:hypothetical protein JCM5296_005630 [Sporobolomyces johnsonii]
MPFDSYSSNSVWISAIVVPPICLLIGILCTVLLYLKIRHRTTMDGSLPSSIPRLPALRSPSTKPYLRDPPSPPCRHHPHRPESPSIVSNPFSPVGSRVVSLTPSAPLSSPSPSYFSPTGSPRGSRVLARTSLSFVTPRNCLASASSTNAIQLATHDHQQHAWPPSALFSREIGMSSDRSERPTAFSIRSIGTASSHTSQSAMGTTIATLGGSHGPQLGRRRSETSGTNQSSTGHPFPSPLSRSSQEHLPPLPISPLDFFHVPSPHPLSPAATLLRSPSSRELHRQDGLGHRSSADVYSLFGSALDHFPLPDGYDLSPSLPFKSPATYSLQNSPSLPPSPASSHSSCPCDSSSPPCHSPSSTCFPARPSALVQRDSTLALPPSPSVSPRWSRLSLSFRRAKDKAGRRLSPELLPPMGTRRPRSACYDKEHAGEIELVLSSREQDWDEEAHEGRGARGEKWMLGPPLGEGGSAAGRKEEDKGLRRASSVGTLESHRAHEGFGNLVLTNPDPSGSSSVRESHDLVRTSASTPHHSLDLPRTPSSA